MAINPQLDQQVSNEAASVSGLLKTAVDSGTIAKLLSKLQTLRDTPNISNATVSSIDTAIGHGQTKLQEKLEDETIKNNVTRDAISGRAASAHAHPPQDAFQSAMFKHMTQSEQNYFLAIDPKKDYTAYTIGKDGKVVKGSAKKIKGDRVRKDFIAIKNLTMSEEERTSVKQEEKKQEENGVPPATNYPSFDKPNSYTVPELEGAKQSLTRLEEYNAGKLIGGEPGKEPTISPEDEEKILRHHSHYRDSENKIDTVIARQRSLERAERFAKTQEEYAAAGKFHIKPIADAVVTYNKKGLKKSVEDMRISLKETMEKAILDDPRKPSKDKEQAIDKPNTIVEANTAISLQNAADKPYETGLYVGALMDKLSVDPSIFQYQHLLSPQANQPLPKFEVTNIDTPLSFAPTPTREQSSPDTNALKLNTPAKLSFQEVSTTNTLDSTPPPTPAGTTSTKDQSAPKL